MMVLLDVLWIALFLSLAAFAFLAWSWKKNMVGVRERVFSKIDSQTKEKIVAEFPYNQLKQVQQIEAIVGKGNDSDFREFYRLFRRANIAIRIYILVTFCALILYFGGFLK